VVNNPRDLRPNEQMTQQPPVPYDPRTGPKTLTPFQTMTDLQHQGRMADFRPIERDARDPEPPAEVREEILRDPSSALTGENPVPTEPIQTPGNETSLSSSSSASTDPSSTTTSPGKNEQPVEVPVPAVPMTPTPTSQDKVNP
jgi:hypothetical protein